MRVCYFGTYDTFQSRNQLLISGLRAVRVDVVECHVPLWRDTDDKMRAVMHGWKTFGLWRRLTRAYVSLLRRAPGCLHHCDAVVVGYTGQLDLFLAWPFARTLGIPLVLDAFNSLTETIVDDRRLVSPHSGRARLLQTLDMAVGRLADAVLVDTEAHRRYFQQTFGVPPARLYVVPAGADPSYRLGKRDNVRRAPTSDFRVLYFGQFIPLHGVDVIVDAARLLAGQDITFHLVGRGQTLPSALRRAAGLEHVQFFQTWLPPDDLMVRHILPADICLGVFDPGPKAGRVIPQKVYAALAAGKPIITGDTPAVRELLTDGRDALLVPPGDPVALAHAICRLRDDPAFAQRLAQQGRRLYRDRFCARVVGATLCAMLTDLSARPAGQQRAFV